MEVLSVVVLTVVSMMVDCSTPARRRLRWYTY